MHDPEDRLYPTPTEHGALWCALILGMLCLGAIFGLQGCGPGDAYVEADASTLRTVGRPYLEYRRADTRLTRDEVRLSELKIESWAARIKEARGD